MKEKIESVAYSENLLTILTVDGSLYSWGDVNSKRITRSQNTLVPSLLRISERIDRKSVPVKFKRLIQAAEIHAMDALDRIWTFKDGLWKKNEIKSLNEDLESPQVQYQGFNKGATS